ncbi:AraC family transcriptional regulator [Kerstersia gyiorum]|jgi:AraC-like DNA-binding protein/mannose-6-phosphate isomerase-like protein (cupin superfamily)|uniref:AraC family transcriptional regulator n=1 Tax=Kerstersia gyiorum TaxID=206506 RepID=UPI00242D0E64|nr:helix-turn-helix transcriptional regulator [Kerstersia gyiorum]MCH4270431.1 helix-turn-helix transcriptional regulator [Kerstersia gyiorum]MCI1230086.1 helix-turn-helix transcriptional regulator [Kerstersia gyiorum]
MNRKSGQVPARLQAESADAQAAQRVLNHVRSLEDQSCLLVGVEAVFSHAAQGMQHSHARIQFLQVLEGALAVRVGTQQWLVPQHHALLLPAGLTHDNRYFGPARVRSLYIAPGLWQAGMPDGGRLVAVPPLLRELSAAVLAIPREPSADDRHALLMALTVREIQHQPGLALRLPMPADRRLQRMCETLLRDPGNRAPLAYWTRVSGLSQRTLTRLFPRETGLSYSAWRQQLLLLAALERLASGRTVGAVALDLGYASASAFGAMFLRQVGMTPSAYARCQAGQA